MIKKTQIIGVILFLALLSGIFMGNSIFSNEKEEEDANFVEDTCTKRRSNENKYIKEFIIPTPCSAPIGITSDINGNIWFSETNSSKIGKYNPMRNEFTEYTITNTDNIRIQSWSLVFDKEENLWFTDHSNNLIWEYDVKNGIFNNYTIPTRNSYPVQILEDDKGMLWISEIYGNKIAQINKTKIRQNNLNGIVEIEPPEKLELLGGIFIDDKNRIWFTMLTYPFVGKIAAYDQETDEFEIIELPEGITSPVGIVGDNKGIIWINDHGSSHFVEYNTDTKSFMKFSTSIGKTAFANTLPYWNSIDSKGNMWMNLHQGNAIAKLDRKTGALIEYNIPTRNEDWGNQSNTLQFTIDNNDNIWFTEWTENKIGFLNSSIDIPFKITTMNDEIEITNNEIKNVELEIASSEALELDFSSSSTITRNGELKNISIVFEEEKIIINGKKQLNVEIEYSGNLAAGQYTIMLSANNKDITYSIPIKIIINN